MRSMRQVADRGRFFSVVVMGCTVLLGLGCNRTPEVTKGPSQQSTTPAPIVPTSKAPVSDESLTSDEYVRLGLPADDREWSGDDMVNAEKVLASLAKTSYRKLPRYKSVGSGKMFDRMASPQNFEFFKNNTLPLNTRLSQAVTYMSASNQILKIYLNGFQKGEVGDSELIELLGAQLRLMVVVQELADEFLPTISKDDPTYQVRMQGVEKMRRGLAGTVGGNLLTVTEKPYRVSERVRLVGYMRETFPVLFPHLLAGSRTELLLRLEKMQQDPSLNELQPGLKDLYVAVKASVEKADAVPSVAAPVAAKPTGSAKPVKPGKPTKPVGSSATTSPLTTKPPFKVKYKRNGLGDVGEDGWTQITSSTVGFRVQLPGKYDELVQSMEVPNGKLLTTHQVGMGAVNGVKFIVTAYEGGDVPPDVFLQGFVDKTEKTGKVREKTDFELDGVKGVQLVVTDARSGATMRLVAGDDLFYVLIAEYPPDGNAATAKDVERFCESFRPKRSE